MFDCDPAAVVAAQLEAFNARDVRAFSAFYAPNAVVYDHPGQAYASGRAEIEGVYGDNFLHWPGLRARVESQIVSGEWVVNDERLSGGAGADFQAVVTYHVRDCLIQRVDMLPQLDVASGEVLY